MIKRETVVAGMLISRRYYWSPDKMPGEKRESKQNPTRQAVMKVNRRNAERELTLKLHANFEAGDLHVTLTYSGEEPTLEEAQAERKNFLKRLRRHFQKNGRILKWIMVTEYENKRIHHHLIVSRMDVVELSKLWKAGRVYSVCLDDSGDYRKLASYLIKETEKTFRNPDAFSKQRYSCSRTVTTPVRKVEDVRLSEALRDPKPVTGYHILEDSVYRGINPVTQIACMEYMMLSNEREPRLKIWRRGRKEKYKERRYDPRKYEVEGQLEIDLNWPGYW